MDLEKRIYQWIPSRRHSSATLLSPRSPSSTIRTFSSAVYFLRVFRRISRTLASTDVFFSAISCSFGCLIQPDFGQEVHLNFYPLTVPQDLTRHTDKELSEFIHQFLSEYNDRPHKGLPIPGLSPNEYAKRIWAM